MLLPRVYEIEFPVAHVPSIRDTISFCILPILQIILFCNQPTPLHSLGQIFSALVFKSNIFMVDGLPATVRFPQLSLKNCQSLSSSNDRWLGAVKSSWVLSLIGHLRTALADKSTEHYQLKPKPNKGPEQTSQLSKTCPQSLRERQ